MLEIRSITLAVVVSLLVACQASPDRREALQSGASGQTDSVMDFELASLDGGTVRPRDADGDLILIDFWATWCGPCHLQADILAKIYPELRSRGVAFYAVSLGEPETVVRDFVAKRPFEYPVLIDPTDSIASKYGLYVLPTVVLLDRDGSVMYLHEGISTAARLRSAVDEIIESKRAKRAGDDQSMKSRRAT